MKSFVSALLIALAAVAFSASAFAGHGGRSGGDHHCSGGSTGGNSGSNGT
jgi:hypothetical protein